MVLRFVRNKLPAAILLMSTALAACQNNNQTITPEHLVEAEKECLANADFQRVLNQYTNITVGKDQWDEFTQKLTFFSDNQKLFAKMNAVENGELKVECAHANIIHNFVVDYTQFVQQAIQGKYTNDASKYATDYQQLARVAQTVDTALDFFSEHGVKIHYVHEMLAEPLTKLEAYFEQPSTRFSRRTYNAYVEMGQNRITQVNHRNVRDLITKQP